MENQDNIAGKRAVQIKGDRQSVKFSYEVNGQINIGITQFGLRKVGDLMNDKLKNEIASNLCPFNSKNDQATICCLLK